MTISKDKITLIKNSHLEDTMSNLDKLLKERKYICGDDYTIADIAIWSWYGQLALGRLYNSAEFLDVASYEYVSRWAKEINARPAVRRGRIVNKTSGRPDMQLHERHDASDFDLRTQDKLEILEAKGNK